LLPGLEKVIKYYYCRPNLSVESALAHSSYYSIQSIFHPSKRPEDMEHLNYVSGDKLVRRFTKAALGNL
jgi:hypothetical protein